MVSRSPGLRGTSYPGATDQKDKTPTGFRLWSTCTAGRNPVGVVWFVRLLPRVARSSQPWALLRNPVGIQRKSSPPKPDLRMSASALGNDPLHQFEDQTLLLRTHDDHGGSRQARAATNSEQLCITKKAFSKPCCPAPRSCSRSRGSTAR